MLGFAGIEEKETWEAMSNKVFIIYREKSLAWLMKKD